jgi:hypothetical protein
MPSHIWLGHQHIDVHSQGLRSSQRAALICDIPIGPNACILGIRYAPGAGKVVLLTTRSLRCGVAADHRAFLSRVYILGRTKFD